MANYTRYQAHCKTCAKVFEADSATEAILAAIDHENTLAQLVQDGKAHPRTHEKIETAEDGGAPPCNTSIN